MIFRAAGVPARLRLSARGRARSGRYELYRFFTGFVSAPMG
jgi:hypothetical protein